MLVAATSLLSMPVSYRGGAEASHPHIFFQFWIDAANDSFDHHHAGAHEESAEDPHGGHEHHGHASHGDQGVAPSPDRTPTVGVGDGHDGPSLTEQSVPHIRKLTLVAASAATAGLPSGQTPATGAVGTPADRSVSPPTPPPRPTLPRP
jgi:hypothetical protein